MLVKGEGRYQKFGLKNTKNLIYKGGGLSKNVGKGYILSIKKVF